MAVDIVDLRAFYASPLGQMARRFVADALLRAWPDARGSGLLGIGFALPYLPLWRDEAERTLAFMPAHQGVVNWPSGEPSATALVEPWDLPLPDGSVDRVLLVHALEAVDNPAELLSEVWRVLTPGGRVIIVAPNRRSLWARMDTTPFGDGRPFSKGQLARLMRDTLFSPERWEEALYAPPIPRGLFLKVAPFWERMGARLAVPPPGVHVIDATKQLYRAALVRPGRRFSFKLDPMLAPVPAPRGTMQNSPLP